MSFRLVPKSVTLNDLERRNGRYFALFRRIRVPSAHEVALRRARLVLGWVTVFGGQTTSVFHQATQVNSAFYPQRHGK